jgi:NAD-reducing hydrogenase small subunit
MSESRKITLATSWLDGCSGCHMSFLDIDERLIELADKVEFVYSPLVDYKQMPESIDVGILEGAVSSEDDLDKALKFRKHCKFLISLGDCAVTGNVPAMRNFFPLDAVFDRAFKENVQLQPQRPTVNVPKLLVPVRPIHSVVKVDLFIPGCPPSANTIWQILSELVAGRMPNPAQFTRFGA